MGLNAQSVDELPRLVVVPGSRHVPVHFLKADQVRVLVFDDLDDSFETIAAVAPADAFMDVITQESHGSCVSRFAARGSPRLPRG